MKENMEHKETLVFQEDKIIIVEIYKLKNCKVYWVMFVELVGRKRNIVRVQVITEYKRFHYLDIKREIRQIIFPMFTYRVTYCQ